LKDNFDIKKFKHYISVAVLKLLTILEID